VVLRALQTSGCDWVAATQDLFRTRSKIAKSNFLGHPDIKHSVTVSAPIIGKTSSPTVKLSMLLKAKTVPSQFPVIFGIFEILITFPIFFLFH
jgi:hypothetical protein